MYEDSDMSLDEYIEKLQQLNGESYPKNKKIDRTFEKISDEQILKVISSGDGVKIGKIASELPNINRRTLHSRLNSLVQKEKLEKKKIHARLCIWKRV